MLIKCVSFLLFSGKNILFQSFTQVIRRCGSPEYGREALNTSACIAPSISILHLYPRAQTRDVVWESPYFTNVNISISFFWLGTILKTLRVVTTCRKVKQHVIGKFQWLVSDQWPSVPQTILRLTKLSPTVSNLINKHAEECSSCSTVCTAVTQLIARARRILDPMPYSTGYSSFVVVGLTPVWFPTTLP